MELVIAFTLIACSISVADYIEIRLANLEKQFSEQGISVNSYKKDNSNKGVEPLGINAEDYEYVSNRYKDVLDISYISYGTVYADGFQTVPVFCMSQQTFFKLFQVDMEERAYIGSSAKELLDMCEDTLGDGSMGIHSKKIELNGESIPFVNFNKEQDSFHVLSFLPFEEYDFLVKDCIILPMSMQQELEKAGIFYNYMCELNFKGIDAKTREDISLEIVEYLSEKHEVNHYKIENKIEQYLRNSENMSSIIKILSWISRFFMIQIAFAMVGVLLILLEQRKKEMAVCMVTGATFAHLFAELFTEIFMICLSGGGIAILISVIVAPQLGNVKYAVMFQPEVILLIVCICAVISFLTCLLSMICVKLKILAEF